MRSDRIIGGCSLDCSLGGSIVDGIEEAYGDVTVLSRGRCGARWKKCWDFDSERHG